jgi:hypothetical protein
LLRRELVELPEVIRSWTIGDGVPEALLSVRYRPPRGGCGIPIIGLSGEDYVDKINNDELLKAILLHPRADDRLFHCAMWKVLTTRKLSESAQFTSELLAQRPKLVEREWLAEVVCALRSPCVLLKIAQFDKDRPVPLARAREVVRAMHGDLLSGTGWKSALNRGQDALRDEAHHKPGEAFFGPTHLSYAFDGSATPDYRDFIGRRDLRTDEYAPVPPGHLEVVFQARGGTHLLETEAAIWLYHAEEYFGGTDPRGPPEARGGLAP